MKLLVLILLCCSFTYAHEDDEMVVVKNSPRFGGRIAAVVKGHDPIYMSEILVDDRNIVRLYLYDLQMKSIDLKSFPDTMTGLISSRKNQKEGLVELKKGSKYYQGNLPVVKGRPYQLKVAIPSKGKALEIFFKDMD